MNKTQTPRQVLNLPAGYFGMVLGTIGMGFAWRYASTLWPVSRSIGDGLVTLAMAMWVLLSMAFISRAIRFPASVLREMRHPVTVFTHGRSLLLMVNINIAKIAIARGIRFL